MQFRLANISHDEKMHSCILHRVSFICYLKTCFEYLGPAVDHLSYKESDAYRSGQPHILPPIKEFFLVMVRLRLGLMEQDIAYQFNISQSTVSRIITWLLKGICNILCDCALQVMGK